MYAIPYESSLQAAWDKTVGTARNGTFLHRRAFMDYHADRFIDASLLVCDDKNQVLAVFPASRQQELVSSHAGLTFGGLLMSDRLTQSQCLRAFELIGSYYRSQGCRRIIYKPVPHIFHRLPAEDELYALFRVGARLIRRDASTAISLRDPFAYTKGRKWSINKGKKAGLQVCRQPDPARFHQLLTQVLLQHQATPVHSLAELRLLMGRFPEQISLYEASQEGELQAAALLFDYGQTVHSQYLATSAQGREVGALDFLLDVLIKQECANRRYFSFGISTEQGGTVLNEGLIAQKEGFGGSTVVHDFYEWCL